MRGLPALPQGIETDNGTAKKYSEPQEPKKEPRQRVPAETPEADKRHPPPSREESVPPVN